MLDRSVARLSFYSPERLRDEPVERRRQGRAGAASRPKAGKAEVSTNWYRGLIIGFPRLQAARSLGLIPNHCSLHLLQRLPFLTTVAMAALGLGVDMRVVAKARSTK